MARRAGAAARLEAALARVWWQPHPGLTARLLQPLSWLYGTLAAFHRCRARRAAGTAPVPVLVVGNLVAGGAGKTPLVMALVQALRAAGHRPAVVSRGHGRRSADVAEVGADSDAAMVGDEPLLIHRRTGVPVFVGRKRLQAARALCAAHPQVDVLVSDDGLQHHALARDGQLIAFDDRGAGNGLLLPAGPLRAALPRSLPPHTWVVYTGQGPSTALPGRHVPRRLGLAWPLAAWHRRLGAEAAGAVSLAQLRGRRLLALAGIGAPAQFFEALRHAGLAIEPWPMPDHAHYAAPPWPAGTTEVVTTEKDAVKLAALEPAAPHAPRVWVVPLDCELPADLVGELLALLPRPAR